MRRGLRWVSQAAAVAVPVAIGIPLAVDGAMTIYTGYASAEWPAAKATVTRFLAVPVAEAETEAEADEAQQQQQQVAPRARWHDVRRRIDRLLNSQHTLDFTVEFEYTLPDGKTYVGTSKRDANFPSRLDLECPSCMMQAETIIDFFGHPGKQFLLFYHPARPTAPTKPPAAARAPPFLRSLLARREKGSDQPEGRYPLYSLDAGMIAPTAYERLAWGSALVGVGGLGLHPRYRTQSWTQRLTTQRGLFPVFCLAVASGVSAFGLSLFLESRLAASAAANNKRSGGGP